MRILHISTRLILGGSQENTVLSCEGQARLGHEVHLAFGPIYGPEGSSWWRVEHFNVDFYQNEIKMHEVPAMARSINPWKDRECYRQLRDLIRELCPDIVHTHSSKAGILGRAAAWAESRRRGRSMPLGVVHTIHGPPFMPIEGNPLSRVRIRLANWLYGHAERYAAKRCHVIVSVADAMTREFLRRGIGSPDLYTTVYSGMEVEDFLNTRVTVDPDTRAYARTRIGVREGDFVIGTVARLAQHKGHDDLLDALADDLRKHKNWRLLWVGDGWWRERLLARAKTLGLQVTQAWIKLDFSTPPHDAQLILTGMVGSEHVPGFIRAMDVLAHPSYREGLPRTVPQALLSGVCPVAYDVDGTGEVCRDMETGRLVRLGDRTGLRDAIRWLHDNPAERAAMASRGREECRTRFSAEHMVARLEEVYARALARARGGERPG